MSEENPASRIPTQVWDVPTRLVHWLMVSAMALSWWTGEARQLTWHCWSGYALLGLVTFRLYWGFFGSSTARFSEFVSGPRTVLAYIKGSWSAIPGHNPLGALSVLALLLSMLAQIALGLFAVDVDGIESGSLSRYVSFATGRAAAEWHETVFNILLAMIVLHVSAIAYYLMVRRENLVAAMFHGTRQYRCKLPAVRRASLPRLLVGVVLAAALTWGAARAFQFG